MERLERPRETLLFTKHPRNPVHTWFTTLIIYQQRSVLLGSANACVCASVACGRRVPARSRPEDEVRTPPQGCPRVLAGVGFQVGVRSLSLSPVFVGRVGGISAA